MIVIEGAVLLAVDWSKTTTIEGAFFLHDGESVSLMANRSHPW